MIQLNQKHVHGRPGLLGSLGYDEQPPAMHTRTKWWRFSGELIKLILFK